MADGYPAKGVKYHGTTVMSTFACGGGSSMGYKLAGYDVIAANDIDPKMAEVYKANHNPKQFFECDVRELLKRDDLPEVDLLDGSPPCSVFSHAGLRHKAWGKEKVFREGQAAQILDDLFFQFAELVGKMQPKVVVAENVEGMIRGKAMWYVHEYCRLMKEIGYETQVFLLDGSTMGLPQKRRRVFFVSNRLGKKVDLDFHEPVVPFSAISDETDTEKRISELYDGYYDIAKEGDAVGKFDTVRKLWWNDAARTITGSAANFHPHYKRRINANEEKLIGSFPSDYNFLDMSTSYLIGMSVPPLMMAKVSHEIYEQMLK